MLFITSTEKTRTMLFNLDELLLTKTCGEPLIAMDSSFFLRPLATLLASLLRSLAIAWRAYRKEKGREREIHLWTRPLCWLYELTGRGPSSVVWASGRLATLVLFASINQPSYHKQLLDSRMGLQ